MSYRVTPNLKTDETIFAVVGCGGTGGFVAEGLCRLLGKSKAEILLVDGDTVEERNLGRQNFFAPELGKFKSEALALRLSRSYGRKVGYSVAPFQKEMVSRWVPYGRSYGPSVIIGCVDNAAARGQIAAGMEMRTTWWIDSGNSRNSGQVLVGDMANEAHFYGGIFDEVSGMVNHLPAPNIQQPALLAPSPPSPGPAPSCAELVAADEQSPVINQVMASLVLELVDKLLRGTLEWMGAYIDMEAGTLSPVPAEPEVVARMMGRKVADLMSDRNCHAVIRR